MHALTKIGDYQVGEPVVVASVVRYAATHVVLPRRATIEMLDAHAPRGAAIRLMRHACILEALHHPGVPRVFECGMLDGRPWVAFECGEGTTLEAELRTRPLTADEVLDVIEQAAAILAHAHARGVLHRDISPTHVIRDPRRSGAIALHGWGHACTHDTELPPPLRGTTRYHAPELVHDRPTDGRADVFALGMIALQALQVPDAPERADVEVESIGVASLIAAMIADEATLRPSAKEVLASVRAIRPRGGIRVEDAISDPDIVLLDQPRAKPRWTPQWALEGGTSRGIVEIMPRRRRSGTEVDR